MCEKVFFNEFFPDGLVAGAAVGLIMLVAAICGVQLYAAIHQCLLRCMANKIMVTIRAYKKSAENICTVRAALPDITFCQELDAVKPVRGDGGRAEVRDTAVFALVQSVPEISGDGVIAQIHVILFFKKQEGTALAIGRFKVVEHVQCKLTPFFINDNMLLTIQLQAARQAAG